MKEHNTFFNQIAPFYCKIRQNIIEYTHGGDFIRIPDSIYQRIDSYCEKLKDYPKVAELYRNCYPNTLETTLKETADGSLFVLTGDIPAMWLRDSTAQVSHYIPLAKTDDEVKKIIADVIRTQMKYILIDPYANAFNEEPNSKGHIKDIPRNDPWVFERKYEIDSLCYPMRLIYKYWKATGDASVFDADFIKAAKTIISVWKTEQHHFEKSPYRFTRYGCSWGDTLHNEGMGMPVSYTGMTWSGFRPSDDSCVFGYLVPSNMFAVVAIGYIIEIFSTYYAYEESFISECEALREEIQHGIEAYAVYDHPKYGKIYACETDGMGNRRLFDDANVPSLLSLPYLGYCDKNDEMYLRTRRFILSEDNPYYYEGKFGRGVGSPHTPDRYIWHIALSMQGLTSDNPDEIREMIEILSSTDAGTGFMHEGFNADNPEEFSREWFAWSNSLFAEFIEYAVDNKII